MRILVWSYACHGTPLHAFPVSCFINSFCAHIVFERPTKGGWHNLSGTTSDSQEDRLEEVAKVLATQRQENSLLTINNYSLKHNGLTIIYIYGNYIAFCCIWETDKWDIWLVQSFYVLLDFSENEAFVGEALMLGDISFLILLSSLRSSEFHALILKTCIWLTNHSFHILLLIFDWSANHLCLWEKYSFHVSDFYWSVKSSQNIG